MSLHPNGRHTVEFEYNGSMHMLAYAPDGEGLDDGLTGVVDEARLKLAVKSFVEATEGIAVAGRPNPVGGVDNRTAKNVHLEDRELREEETEEEVEVQ